MVLRGTVPRRKASIQIGGKFESNSAIVRSRLLMVKLRSSSLSESIVISFHNLRDSNISSKYHRAKVSHCEPFNAYATLNPQSIIIILLLKYGT
ncbi:hypothetical protein CDAR_89791 [Caerostris darwini]|uniref:Uncharacterized protein n=1 Tax=Caerostris darwini TaxID=1538125 RepID=A0AAV4UXN3_9ARAC|nr:hypothetical protein CDAR_89791 [Caerostris darwini]